jgi:phosphohistidine phosphatase SixA
MGALNLAGPRRVPIFGVVRRGLVATMVAAIALVFSTSTASADEALWTALREGRAVAIMRHALAPGTGDPAEFRLDDCSTQRNLSDQGRDQARAIGAQFRANHIGTAAIRTSQWCRCLETARLLDLGPVEELPALNSFFRNRAREPEQTAATKSFLSDWDGARPLVLVTHQVNITALTGVFPTSGEIVVVGLPLSDEAEVLGTIQPSE